MTDVDVEALLDAQLKAENPSEAQSQKPSEPAPAVGNDEQSKDSRKRRYIKETQKNISNFIIRS
jgi:hypothetical protein